MMHPARLLLVVLGLALTGVVCVERVQGQTPQTTRTPADPILREILSQMDNPPGAPGRRLTLVRYTIAPGAVLPPHTHPGVQMASIVSGVLTYRVVSGTAIVHRAVNPDGSPTTTERLVGPAETTLKPGDAVIEAAEMVHFGSNGTNQPIIILATLITVDAGLSMPAPVSTP